MKIPEKTIFLHVTDFAIKVITLLETALHPMLLKIRVWHYVASIDQSGLL